MLLFTTLALGAPASAVPVTIQITGTWDSVTDSAGVLDGSIAVAGSWTATLVYEDSVSDTAGSSTTGIYPIPAAAFDLTFTSGSYSFSVSASENGEIAIENGVSGFDTLYLYAENFALGGPVAAGISLGFGYVNATLSDSSQTAHSSDALTDLAWNLGAYDTTDFYFFAEVLGAGPGDYIELDGPITGLSIIPEPTTALLHGLGLATLSALARRRTESRHRRGH
jgi:hypothetical protein